MNFIIASSNGEKFFTRFPEIGRFSAGSLEQTVSSTTTEIETRSSNCILDSASLDLSLLNVVGRGDTRADPGQFQVVAHHCEVPRPSIPSTLFRTLETPN